MRALRGLSLLLAAFLGGCQDAGQQAAREGEHESDPAAVSDPLGMAPAAPAKPGADAPPTALDRVEEQTGTARFVARAGGEPPDVGIPIYPGAHALAGGTWQLSDQMDEGADSLTTFALFTPHRLAAVLEFYRGRLQVDPAASFTVQGRGGRSVSITVDTPGYNVNLLLRESSSPQGTHIEVSAMAATAHAPPT